MLTYSCINNQEYKNGQAFVLTPLTGNEIPKTIWLKTERKCLEHDRADGQVKTIEQVVLQRAIRRSVE